MAQNIKYLSEGIEDHLFKKESRLQINFLLALKHILFNRVRSTNFESLFIGIRTVGLECKGRSASHEVEVKSIVFNF